MSAGTDSYEAPALTVLGSVSEITQGGTGPVTDVALVGSQ